MNYERLKLAMDKKGVTDKMMYTQLGISRSAFYRKCRGITEFTQSEIQKIVDYLQLESPMGIFFDEKVSQTT